MARDIIWLNRRPMAVICAETAARYGKTTLELKARYSDGFTISVRQIAMAAMVAAGHSNSAVGRFFGRDHSTVYNARRRVAQGLDVPEARP